MQYTSPTITDDQLEVIKANYKNLSREALAKKVGITKGKLNGNMQFFGLRKNPLAAKTCSEPAKPGMFDEHEYKKTLVKY